jgi:glutamine amidotransferase
MCRIAAYLGNEINLAQFLLAPAHSLYHQSYAARELGEATVSADGFGVGWYDLDSKTARYRHTLPIWSDPNLDSLGTSLSSHCWVGNVRSATSGMTLNIANTQPFTRDAWLYVHNGMVENFSHGLRLRLQRFLSDEVLATIEGTTDSEYLFALWLEMALRQPAAGPASWLRAACGLLTDWLGTARCLFNCILTEGEHLYALRHAYHGKAPSLYYCADTETFPEAQLVASEPLDEGEYWQSIPAGQLLILSPNRPAILEPL